MKSLDNLIDNLTDRDLAAWARRRIKADEAAIAGLGVQVGLLQEGEEIRRGINLEHGFFSILDGVGTVFVLGPPTGLIVQTEDGSESYYSAGELVYSMANPAAGLDPLF